jgi:hypothetical protein
VIQLPSLLTIFGEQKPLKSNEHGKTHLHVLFFRFYGENRIYWVGSSVCQKAKVQNKIFGRKI